MHNAEPLRLCEWGSVEVDLDAGQRTAIADAVETWRERSALPFAPLEFGGPDGRRLSARQYVGVVEVENTTVEIYPKLDKRLLRFGTIGASEGDAVMRNLLWMLDVSGYAQVMQTDTAHLEENPVSYQDLFAYMMAGELIRELEAGLAHVYVREEDDIQWVRGKIRLETQYSRNWMRPDRIACSWDEFTVDTPLNRLLKCACRLLAGRVRHPFVAAMLNDCAWMLSDAGDVDPTVALSESGSIRWDRHSERFRRSYEVARQLLDGMGYDLARGDRQTFVFLLDMNILFEHYALRILEQATDAMVSFQDTVGSLIRRPSPRIRQIADFWWITADTHWIADAKYKFLYRDHEIPLPENEPENEPVNGESRISLSPADIRQLTVYAEMLKQRLPHCRRVDLVIVYPYAGQGEFEFRKIADELWNGSALYLMPLKLTPCEDSSLRSAMPSLSASITAD